MRGLSAISFAKGEQSHDPSSVEAIRACIVADLACCAAGPSRARTRDAACGSAPDYAVRPGGGGDKLAEPCQIAAIVVAQGGEPKSVVDVGSFTGEFLEAFIARFPKATGQWTEPVDNNLNNAKRCFVRYGDRISFKIGCPGRDIALGCVPAGVDTLLTSWVSIHHDRPGIAKFYKDAFAMLPPGGWIANIDHVATGLPAWDAQIKTARETAARDGIITPRREGPSVHHPEWTLPTLDEQIASMRAAGFPEPIVVWRRFDTVLLMARKP
jgi:hypothetical protein